MARAASAVGWIAGVGSGRPALVEHGVFVGAGFEMGQQFGFAVEASLDVVADSTSNGKNLLSSQLYEATVGSLPIAAIALIL